MRGDNRWARGALLAMGLANLAAGLWLRLAPRSFYDDFPGFDSGWVSSLGAYSGHAFTDYGAALIGFSAALIAVALRPGVRALPLVTGAWLLAAVPHFLYHAVATEPLSTGQNAGNLGLLALTVVVPAAVLVADRRAAGAAAR